MVESTGKAVKIEGRVSGSQPLTITWYKDEQKISASDKYDISLKNNIAVLCVRDSIVSDSGLYTCEVSNEAGKASCQVSLVLSGKNVSISSLKPVGPHVFVEFLMKTLLSFRLIFYSVYLKLTQFLQFELHMLEIKSS